MNKKSNNIKVSPELIEKVKKHTIYFAHKSVGYNILEGIEDIAYQLTINEISDQTSENNTVIFHSQIGENNRPLLKLDDFAQKLDSEDIISKVDIAMLKFCYLDINEETDIESLFTSYKETFQNIETKYPKITFVHFTNPLRAQEKGLKPFIKRILGRPVKGFEDNFQREKFNQLIRQNYSIVFDLAEIESTKPDGTRMLHSMSETNYYSLYPGYTIDGGHLNEEGRKVVASKLIQFLAEL